MPNVLPTQLLSSCEDSGLLICIARWANDVTGGLFWLFALLGFCVVLYMTTARFGTKRSLGFSAFVGMIGSVWFAIMGLMSWYYASAFIIVGLISAIVMIVKE